jgi:hypothetical protein
MVSSPYYKLTPQQESGIRSRRADLVKLGMIVDTGRKERLATGRLATVWRALEGQEIAAQDGSAARVVAEVEARRKAKRTEGTLFDPEEGAPKKRGYID